MRVTSPRRVICAATATLCALAALSAASSASAATVPPTIWTPVVPADTYGVNAQAVFPLGPSGWGPHLDAIASHGLGVVRYDLTWRTVEPKGPTVQGQHTYDWSAYDPWVRALAARGIRWQPMIGYDATYAGAETIPGNPYSAPNPTDYAALVAAVAGHYGRGGTFWQQNPDLTALPVTTYEIWNEPNLGRFWSPRCDPATYGQLFSAAQSALHQVDPQAVAVVGGLSTSPNTTYDCDPNTFMQQLAALDPTVAPTIKAVGFHPYDSYYDHSELQIQRFRGTLNGIGLAAAPLYITEIGWATQGAPGAIPDDAASPPNRTDAFTKIADRWPFLQNCNIRNVMIHTWLSAEQDPNAVGDWYGIVSPTLDSTGNVVLHDSAVAYTREAQLWQGQGATAPTAPSPIPLC